MSQLCTKRESPRLIKSALSNRVAKENKLLIRELEYHESYYLAFTG